MSPFLCGTNLPSLVVIHVKLMIKSAVMNVSGRSTRMNGIAA